MFVHYYTEVPLPLAEVEKRLDHLRVRLDDLASVVYREGEELRAKVGPGINAYAKEVRLEIGAPEIGRSGLVYPLTWTATGAESLFPAMRADLIISHIGSHHTRVSFEGTYQPPLGPLGKVVDRVLLGKVAESTVKNWVDRLAGALVTNSIIV